MGFAMDLTGAAASNDASTLRNSVGPFPSSSSSERSASAGLKAAADVESDQDASRDGVEPEHALTGAVESPNSGHLIVGGAPPVIVGSTRSHTALFSMPRHGGGELRRFPLAFSVNEAIGLVRLPLSQLRSQGLLFLVDIAGCGGECTYESTYIMT